MGVAEGTGDNAGVVEGSDGWGIVIGIGAVGVVGGLGGVGADTGVGPAGNRSIPHPKCVRHNPTSYCGPDVGNPHALKAENTAVLLFGPQAL